MLFLHASFRNLTLGERECLPARCLAWLLVGWERWSQAHREGLSAQDATFGDGTVLFAQLPNLWTWSPSCLEGSAEKEIDSKKPGMHFLEMSALCVKPRLIAVFPSPSATLSQSPEDGRNGDGARWSRGETGQRLSRMPEENGLLLGSLSSCILLSKETDKNGCDVQFSQRGISFLCSRIECPLSWRDLRKHPVAR